MVCRQNFGVSARSRPAQRFFVIEADEYDTAFFDKRSKFVHYRPRTTILNNLEYDHADIFSDLGDIIRQFHHLVRTVPADGQIIVNQEEPNLGALLELGCWTPVERFGIGGDWLATPVNDDCSEFKVLYKEEIIGSLDWTLIGRYNMMNALAAIVAARHVGVPAEISLAALAEYKSVKRRLEVRGQVGGITIYDDFAHHPTAIAATLAALRAHIGKQRLIAVLEPRSNTMRMGVHQHALANSLSEADRIYLVVDDVSWDIGAVTGPLDGKAQQLANVDSALAELVTVLKPGDHVAIMSNGGFGNIHENLLSALKTTMSVNG